MCAQSVPLSPVDTAWLHMEHPTNLMMITCLSTQEGPIDFPALRTVYERRLLQFRRFRQRVVEGTLGIGRPYWEDDPHFNIDSHIHHVALPQPGGRRELLDLLSDLSSTPLDYTKPLWQVHAVDNVEGNSAVVFRVHHCVGDGTAMVAVIQRLLDATPDWSHHWTRQSNSRARRGFVSSLAGGVARGTQAALATLLDQGRKSLAHPPRLVDMGQTVARSALQGASLAGHALTQPHDPVTVFKGKLGVAKRVAWSDPVTVDESKRIAHALGAKINDVLVSAMTGALRRYMLSRGDDVEGVELRAVIPVDMRSIERAEELGNVFGLVFLAMPVNIADPGERLHCIKQRMDTLKQSGEAIFYYGLLNLFGMTPKQVEESVVEFFAARATAVFSNVAGPRSPLYFAGMRVRDCIFWVPQSGRLGMGISIMSYNNRMTLGVITDAALVPDPEHITDTFIDEYQVLARVALQAAAARAEGQERPRCAALTRTGSPCRNLAAHGLSYCQQHAAR
jgi:diacylglycerol O-acyltransferase / wax synthase